MGEYLKDQLAFQQDKEKIKKEFNLTESGSEAEQIEQKMLSLRQLLEIRVVDTEKISMIELKQSKIEENKQKKANGTVDRKNKKNIKKKIFDFLINSFNFFYKLNENIQLKKIEKTGNKEIYSRTSNLYTNDLIMKIIGIDELTIEKKIELLTSKGGKEYLRSPQGKELLNRLSFQDREKLLHAILKKKIEEAGCFNKDFKEFNYLVAQEMMQHRFDQIDLMNLDSNKNKNPIHKKFYRKYPNFDPKKLNSKHLNHLSMIARKFLSKEHSDGSTLLRLAIDKGQVELLEGCFFPIPRKKAIAPLSEKEKANLAAYLPYLVAKLSSPKKDQYIAVEGEKGDGNFYIDLFMVEKSLLHIFYYEKKLFDRFKQELELLPQGVLPYELEIYKSIDYDSFKNMIESEVVKFQENQVNFIKSQSLEVNQKKQDLKQIQIKCDLFLGQFCLDKEIFGTASDFDVKWQELDWSAIFDSAIENQGEEREAALALFNGAYSPISSQLGDDAFNCFKMQIHGKPVLCYLLHELNSNHRSIEQKHRIKQMMQIILARSPSMMNQKTAKESSFKQQLNQMQDANLKSELIAFIQPESILHARILSILSPKYTTLRDLISPQ